MWNTIGGSCNNRPRGFQTRADKDYDKDRRRHWQEMDSNNSIKIGIILYLKVPCWFQKMQLLQEDVGYESNNWFDVLTLVHQLPKKRKKTLHML